MRNNCQDGVSLLELLVALTIAIAISSVLIVALRFEGEALATNYAQTNVNSSLQFADQRLRYVFQNMASVSLDSSGTVVSGPSTADPNTVYSIRLENPLVDSVPSIDGVPVVGILITTTTSTGQTTQVVRGTECTFAGTTFQVVQNPNGSSESLVSVRLVVEYVGPSKMIFPASVTVTAKYAVGGGY